MSCKYCGKSVRTNADYCSSRCLRFGSLWGTAPQKPKRQKQLSRVLEDPQVDIPPELTAQEKTRLYALRRYGLTPDDYDQLQDRQGGVCAVCERRKAQVIDHCHATGRVRGLLCHGCNSAIGVLGDTVESLKRAVEYLESHEVFTSLPPLRR